MSRITWSFVAGSGIILGILTISFAFISYIVSLPPPPCHDLVEAHSPGGETNCPINSNIEVREMDSKHYIAICRCK